MINNAILQGYLNCKYHPYSAFSGNIDSKKEFEEMQNLFLDRYKKDFHTHLLAKYGKDSIIDNFEFGVPLKKKRLAFYFGIKINKSEFNLIFDCIEIIKKSSKISYIPILLSINDSVSKREKLLLAIQCLIFTRLTGINLEFARVIYGKEFKTLKIELHKYTSEATKIIEELDKTIKDESGTIILGETICKKYEFEDWYHSKLVEKNDLHLLSSIREKERLRYEKKGIFTVKQLSYTFKPRKKNEWIKRKEHPFHHSLQALAIREQKVYIYDEINLPDVKKRVFIDMEGNSYGSFVYLIGVLVKEESDVKFYSFWANNHNEERIIFKQFIDLINELGEAQLFYYGTYDSDVFSRINLVIRDKKFKEIVLNKSIDVLKSIRRNIYFPTYSNGLKEIGNFLGCKWSDKTSSGIQSLVWRWKWENSRDEKIKGSLIQYNKEDCLALNKVVDFLYSISQKIFQDPQLKDNYHISIVKSAQEDENRKFKNMTYATKDIEIITKAAYFQYQRNKIFFRTNKSLRKIKKNNLRKLRMKSRMNIKCVIKSDSCPFCQSKNLQINEKKKYTKLCYDLKFSQFGIKRWNTLYQSFLYYCRDCKEGFVPKKFKNIYIYTRKELKHERFNSLRRNHTGYGHNLLSFVINQNIIDRTTFRNIEKNLWDYFNLLIDSRRLWWLKIVASQYYHKTYQTIIKKLISGNLIHSDETKAKLRTNSGYIWVLTNMEEVVYLYKPNREAGFLKDLLKGFKGVLVTDFYSGYDSLNCPQQKCLVHLMRDLNDELLKNPFDEELKWIVTEFGSLLRNIIKTLDKFGLKKRYLHKHRKDVRRFFRNLKSKSITSDIAVRFKKRLIAYENELFLFLDYDGIPWNNNNAEYSIKHFATYRPSLKGSATINGLEASLILLSIYQTCKYKGINFLDFLLSKEKDIDKFMLKHKNKR